MNEGECGRGAGGWNGSVGKEGGEGELKSEGVNKMKE